MGCIRFPLDSYNDESFYGILPEPLSQILGKKALQTPGRELVVVDLMASTGGLRSLARILKSDFGCSMKGVTVSLTDDRSEAVKIKDAGLGIQHIAADLGQDATWDRLSSAVPNGMADYIVSAGVGGLSYLPHHRDYYTSVMQRLWGMLRPEGGAMTIEVPSNKRLAMVGIGSLFRATFTWQQQGISVISASPGSTSVIHIERNPSNPAELPRCDLMVS
ncbi:hypothetical protein KA016_03935 [Candidatus Saccharibacteria bacterium]|nr:hypothetical protein [Candidatus Saccharibacteria bacterium]